MACLYTVAAEAGQHPLDGLFWPGELFKDGLTLVQVYAMGVGELNVPRLEDVVALKEHELPLSVGKVGDGGSYGRGSEQGGEKILEEHPERSSEMGWKLNQRVMFASLLGI